MASKAVPEVKRKEERLEDDMPFGFIKKEGDDAGKVVNLKECQLNLDNLVRFEHLNFVQKQELVTSSWEKGFWDDVEIENENFERDRAIELVNGLKESEYKSFAEIQNSRKNSKSKRIEKSTFGNILMELALMGYEHMYKGLFPLKEEEFPLSKIEKKPFPKPSEEKVNEITISTDMKKP